MYNLKIPDGIMTKTIEWEIKFDDPRKYWKLIRIMTGWDWCPLMYQELDGRGEN